MKERVKELRTTLGLTMEKFGKKLGVGKTAISKIEKGENSLTDQMLKAICNVNWDGKYVNEDWLRGNSEEMFRTDPGNELKALAEKYQMSNMEYTFLKEFFKLDSVHREEFFETLDKVFSRIYAGDIYESSTTKRTIHEMSREEIHAELDYQLDEEKEAVGNALGYGRGNSDMAIR